jgi:hypothetical protein
MPVNLITTEEIVIDVKKQYCRIGGTLITRYILKTQSPEFNHHRLSFINKLIGRQNTLTSETSLPKEYTNGKIATLKEGDIIKFIRSKEKDTVIFEVTDENGETISSIPYPKT